MRKWIDPAWYQYVWRRKLPPPAKLGLVSALVAACLAGGWFAAGRLTGAQADSGSAYVLASTTTQKVVTVHEHGKAVVKRIPVVRIVRLKAQKETVLDFRTVTTPGGVSVQRVTRLRYVPVKKIVSRTVTNTVLRNGKSHTVVSVRPVTVQQTVRQTTPGVTESRTETQVVTNDRTVVDQRTVVDERTVTLPPVTQTEVVTETRPVVSTQTVTVTSPPVTVVVTNVATVTVPGLSIP